MTLLQHKGQEVEIRVRGPHVVYYLEPFVTMRKTRAEIVVHVTPATEVSATTTVANATVRKRLDENGRQDWHVMADAGAWEAVGGGARNSILDLFLHEPTEHDNLKMRDPVRLVLVVHNDAGDLPARLPTDGLSDFTVGRVSEYGRGPDSVRPGGVVLTGRLPRPPRILHTNRRNELLRRMALPASSGYGKAADKCRRNGDGLGSHERGHLAQHVLTGSFLGDSKVMSGSIRKADMRCDALANLFVLLADGMNAVDPRGRHVKPLLRASLIDNRTRSPLVGIEGLRNDPNPSKRVNDDGYAQNWSIVGRALAGRFLMDTGLMSQVMSPVDEQRWALGLEQFARHVVHLFEIPGLPGRTYALDNGQTADYAMWRGADLVTLLAIACALPNHPDAPAWISLCLDKSPARIGAIRDTVRASSLYGLFREDLTFADRPSYYAGGGPMLSDWAGLTLMICDWMQWAPPAHLEQFVRAGALGLLDCLPQKPGDILRDSANNPRTDSAGNVLLKQHPDAALSAIMPLRCVPGSWDQAQRDKLCAGWHLSLLNDWE